MRFRFAAASLMLALVAGCADSGVEDDTGTPADEAAIRALNTAYGTHWTSMDTTAILAAMADDFVEVSADGTHSPDKAAAAAMMRTGFAARPAGMALTVNTSYVKFLDDDVAISGGTWTLTGAPMGSGMGSWMGAYRKEGETWKSVSSLAAEHVPMPAAPAATTDSVPPAQ